MILVAWSASSSKEIKQQKSKQTKYKNKQIQQMDKLSEISLENTVTLKIDCLLNQELLAKNFNIVMECLNDLQNQIQNNCSELAGLSGLKQVVKKLSQEVQQNTKMMNNFEKNTEITQGQSNKSNDYLQLDNLLKDINQLKERMTREEGFTNENTKDINLLMLDMKDAKKDIEALKKQLTEIQFSNRTNLSNGIATNQETNLGKNHHLNQEVLNQLNQQSQEHNKIINKLQKQMDETQKNSIILKNSITDLNLKLNQVFQEKKIDNVSKNMNNNESEINQNSNQAMIDTKNFNDMIKKIDYLTKKAQNIQSQVLNNTRCINQLNETAQKNSQQIDQQKGDINNIHIKIQQFNKILNQLHSLNNPNEIGKFLNEIDKLKHMYENLLKMVNVLKNSNQSQSDSSHLEERNSSSKKVMSKVSQERSFRKRSDSVDLAGRIRQLTDRIKHLEKLIGEQNPEKLPAIGWKKPNQTAYNGEKTHKKDLAQMKNDLQIWIKSYLDSQTKGHGNLAEIELKMQEIKNILAKKADHEGMKKGLAFLQAKITQLYLFLTEPDSEDAMIVRKGFNCLSCSKKVENLRGKLGPRMNWDNLNTNHHGHTPPKVGFPKYADFNQKESI